MENVKTNTMIFSLKNQPGGLAKALKVLQVNYLSNYNIKKLLLNKIYYVKIQAKRVNVVHIESRRSQRRNSQFEIMLDVQCDDNRMGELVASLQQEVAAVKLLDFEMGLDPPDSPASINESFGKLLIVFFY